MSEDRLKPATLTCHIQSDRYPDYWGQFRDVSISPDRMHKSIGITITKTGSRDFNFKYQWWMPRTKKPTWGELHEKLDALASRFERSSS